MSSRISFNKLNNTRDLGGMHTTDGRMIRPGKLIRSGQLYAADENDMKKLAEQLDLIVDLRTEKEIDEKPDPLIPGVKYCCIPVLDSFAPGVTRDERSIQEAMQRLFEDSYNTRQYMCGLYAGFIEAESAAVSFGDFVKTLLTKQDKGILWHCTAGKDRAGFASVIIEEILGVRREEIIAEYMATNGFISDEIQSMYSLVHQRAVHEDPKTKQILNYLFLAQEDYLSASYAKAEELFGSFDGYIEKRLGITEEEKERLKILYLE